MTKEDQAFLAQQKSSEHIAVFRRLIKEAREQILVAIAGAKDLHQLAIAQGVVRGMNALDNSLTHHISFGDAILKESEKNQ